ncbi:lateral signaling target protein 2 homolog isoform X2 [Anguilla rostrata]
MELNAVDLRKDPQKYLVLLNRLRVSQDQMLRSIELVMEDCIPAQRQSRDYHVKFPDEILHENLGVQLWFAAECLSAGSFLEVREVEGQRLRPLAEQMLQCLEDARLQLREQSLGDGHAYSLPLREALLRYDSAFSQFELSYVSTVIPVKSAEELQRQQEIVVLFCETVDRALKLGYLKQELIDGYEPLVMFTIPRLAIICGLLIFPDGPLNLQHGSQGMSSLFSPFYTLLVKIRDLLRILTKEELYVLEKSLCAAESSGLLCSAPPAGHSPTDYVPMRAGDYGGSRRRLFRSAHAVPPPLRPTTPSETEPHPHSIALGDDRTAVHSPPQPSSAPSPELPSGAPPSVHHMPSSPLPPEPASPTSSAPPTILALPTTPPSGLSTAAGSTPSPQADCVTRPQPGEQIANATGLAAPVRERFYYYRSPAEPRVGTVAECTWRSRRRQSWHCGQLPPGTDPRRPGMGHNARHASSRDLRARYSSSNDMVHRLFVCISGVADQLQTNFASDMRAILKSVFELIVSRDDSEEENVENKRMEEEEKTVQEESGLQQEGCELCVDQRRGVPRVGNVAGPPVWVPDSACDHCMACHAPFTLLRRRHHCRSCGKIFCSRCSPNEAPLPRLGQRTPVRVCNHCFSCHTVGETAQL